MPVSGIVWTTMDDLPFDFAKRDFPLAEATRYGVGGPAKVALFPRVREELIAAYEWMIAQGGRHLVLGGGSNVLIRDGGFDGVVLFTNCLDRIDETGTDTYYVDSGVDLDALLQQVLLPNNYAGVGGLTGIPGSVGGAIFMNAGTVNGSICQLMTSVDVLRPDGVERVPMDASLYGYRGQTFCPPGHLILGGAFSFTVAEEDQRALYDHYIGRRREKQPPGKSCGSVFKNPENDHAGRLIEACGLKGTRRGGAIISDMHANFVINENGARCADILDLIALAKATVADRFGIELHEEVRVFGDD